MNPVPFNPTFPTAGGPSPMQPNPHGPNPPILSTIIVAAGAYVASGMATWTPGEWGLFIAYVVGAVGTVLKMKRDHVKLRTEVRQDVQAGLERAAQSDPLANTMLPRTPEELKAFIAEAVEEARRQRLAAEAKIPPPTN